jgi:DTW domain-containing protein YfiP
MSPPDHAALPGTPRARCPRCERPLATCLCGWVRPVVNALPVLLLQHPLEVHQAKGSGRLLALSLARCRLAVGEAFDPAELATWLAELGEAPVLLYPDTPAVPAPAVLGSGDPSGLVVIDATWRKSLRMLHANPGLQALPRLALQAPPPSRYGIRAARRPDHQRSTLEATCLALAGLEAVCADGAARHAPLLTAFDGFVAVVASRAPKRPG